MNWLKERREQLEMSQGDLARELQLEGIEISRGAVGHWETGRYEPPMKDEDFRRALAKVLQVDAGELLRLAGYEVLNSRHSTDGERAAHIVDNMPPEKRQMALKILKAMEN